MDLTHQLFSANSIYPPPYGGNVRDSGTLQASASWELDFFGKNRAALNATLGRRSAIAAARWRVEAALQDVAAAKAQFYPNINLVAFAGLSSIGFDKLLNSKSEQWGVGPALRLPIFDSGRLRANLRGKTADLDAAIESYNAQLLDAVHEVADRITSAKGVRRQQIEQSAAQSASETAYSIALQRYQAGLGNYLTVLSAEAPLLLQRRQGVDLAARALDTQAQILHAVGGDITTVATATATTTTTTQ